MKTFLILDTIYMSISMGMIDYKNMIRRLFIK